MTRRCEACGRVYYPKAGRQRWCSDACRYRARRPAERERYGTEHKRLRRRWKVTVDAGRASCARCGLPIEPGSPWDLDHADTGQGYLGPSHAACNRATAGRETLSDGSWGIGVPSRRW